MRRRALSLTRMVTQQAWYLHGIVFYYTRDINLRQVFAQNMSILSLILLEISMGPPLLVVLFQLLVRNGLYIDIYAILRGGHERTWPIPVTRLPMA
jgi:hypothetical protein